MDTTSAENILEIIQEANREEDVEIQVDITKHLGTIAAHLGPTRTREDLLPLIKENFDLHDELLLILSEQLENFIPLVGGWEHSQIVLDILIKLCNTDEPIVRDRAVLSLKKIADEMNPEQIESLFLPQVTAMATESWFTSKCSAAALFPTIYPKVNDDKKTDLRNSFRTLIQDDSLIVRKNTANALVEFIPLLDKDNLKNEFIPVFDNISKDSSESVRVFAVDVAIALAERLTETEIEESIIKPFEEWANDSSWRIRQKIADSIAIIQTVIKYNKFRGRIIAMYQKLVNDFESEVRVKAAKSLFIYSETLKKNYAEQNMSENFIPVFQQSILPQIKLLMNDVVEEVRLAAAGNLLKFSSLLDRDLFKNEILPLTTEVLENENCMAIQESILYGLNQLPETVDLTQSLHSIKNVVRNLIINSQSRWRIRRNLVVAITHISRFASKEFFSENLKINYAALLGDPVFAVRRSAAVILPLLAKQYSIDWTLENIIPFFTMFTKDSRYLYRYVPLFGIEELINSSLNQKGKYMKDFEALVKHTNEAVSKKSTISVVKISKWTARIKEKLEEQKCKDILSLSKNVSGFKETDKIDIYAEDILDTLKNCSNCDIFSVDEQSLIADSYTYLEGILYLIYTKFLKVVIDLFDDAIINIQIRSLYILTEIKELIDKLENELKQIWVQQLLEQLHSDELEAINNEINTLLVEEESKTNENEDNREGVESLVNLGNICNIAVIKENLEEKLQNVEMEEKLQNIELKDEAK